MRTDALSRVIAPSRSPPNRSVTTSKHCLGYQLPIGPAQALWGERRRNGEPCRRVSVVGPQSLAGLRSAERVRRSAAAGVGRIPVAASGIVGLEYAVLQ